MSPKIITGLFGSIIRSGRFEQSVHMPNIEEPEKFQRELIAIAHEWCSENLAAKRSSAP